MLHSLFQSKDIVAILMMLPSSMPRGYQLRQDQGGILYAYCKLFTPDLESLFMDYS